MYTPRVQIPLVVALFEPEKQMGLLAHDKPPEGYGLLLKNASSIHTIGMRFSIDVVFLDEEFQVLAVVQAMPGISGIGYTGTRHILELAPGAARPYGLVPGVQLVVPGTTP